MTIWKWEVGNGGGTKIEVPKGTEFLDVQVQKGQIVVWGLCDPESESEHRLIMVYNTGVIIQPEIGHPAPLYLGTVQLHGGDIIKHVFVQ